MLSIEHFTKNIYERIEPYILDEDILFDMRLVLNELIVNGALHGNACDESKLISVAIHIDDTTIRLTVKDQGRGIGCAAVRTDRESDMMGGRGLGIVRSLIDEMETFSNRIVCVKYL